MCILTELTPRCFDPGGPYRSSSNWSPENIKEHSVSLLVGRGHDGVLRHYTYKLSEVMI